MTKPKRVNAFLASLQQDQNDQIVPQIEQEHTEVKEVSAISIIEPSVEKKQESAKIEEKKTITTSKKGDYLKQVNLTIGEEREFKLDDLAYHYARKRKHRVNRNDVVRYLIDNATIEELVKVDLSKHEK